MKIKTLLFMHLLLLGIYDGSYAQKTKPSENSSSTPAKLSKAEQALLDKKAEADEKIFNDGDPDFKVTEIPEKWKNESAVVICQKVNFYYAATTSSYSEIHKIRKQVKLLDKAGVSEFSEFYFSSYNKDINIPDEIGVRVLKVDGSIVIINTQDAILVNSDVPVFYRAYSDRGSKKYKKLAIPDLQPGDIIDFYYNEKEIFSSGKIGGMPAEMAFDDVAFTMSSTYPILCQKFRFILENKLYLNCNSYYGAPELKRLPPEKNSYGTVLSNVKTYEIVDKDREKLRDELWYYPFASAPCIKLQAIWNHPSGMRFSLFKGERDSVLRVVSPAEMKHVASNAVKSAVGGNVNALLISDYLHDRKKLGGSLESIINDTYYYYRYRINWDREYYNNFYFNSNYNPNEIEELYSVSDEWAIAAFLYACKKEDVDADVFITTARTSGSLENMLMANEAKLGMKFSENGKSFYLTTVKTHSSSGLDDSSIEGQKAYAVPAWKNKKIEAEALILPTTTYKENVQSQDYTIAFSDDLAYLNVVRESKFTGFFRDDQFKMALACYDFRKEERKRFDKKYNEEKEQGGKSSKAIEERRKLAAALEERARLRNEYYKNNIQSEMDVESYDNFELINAGRFNENPDLVYRETFKLKNLINNAGKNYIFDVGKLIGKQVELTQENLERENDINLPFAKSLINTITIAIPEGYMVDALNELNVKVDNESGSFSATAKQEGNKLTITTEKCYKKNFEKKENWPNMVSFLELAYKYSQKKVILKKV